MAIYELKCKKCDHEYDIFSLMDEMDENIKKAKCEECGSKSKDQIIAGAGFNFAGDAVVGTDRWNSDSKGHDYRFKYNAPTLKKQRTAAEIASHVGSNPYPHIDDISSGKNFGEVK